MRLQEDARPPQQRKVSVPPPGRVLGGVDVRPATHHAWIGPHRGLTCRQLVFPPRREGGRRWEQTLRAHLVNNSGRRLLSAMEPSGLDGQGLSDRGRRGGSDVCLVRGQAVPHHHKTMQAATRQTEEQDASRVWALRRPGTFVLPGARAGALPAASRVRHRPRALTKRVRHRRHHLRAALPRPLPA